MADMPKRYKPRLEAVTLDVSMLTCQCYVWSVPRTQILAGLVVFHGLYRPGSAGSDDARFIRWRIRELCELRLPSSIEGLLVDFRDMAYEYGDNLSVDDNPLDDDGQPIRVVVQPSQIEAFRGVIGDHRLRTDLEEAAAEVSDILRGLRFREG